MGIQINGQTDTISASDGGLAVSGYELTGASNINVTGIITTSQLNVGTGGTVITTTAGGNINIDSGGVFYNASNNRLGINTASPSTRLSVVAGSANGIELGQDSDQSTDSSRLFFSTSAGSNAIHSSSGILRFFSGSTAGSSSGSERMRILPAGGITFNADTAAANALDDYEEGTWSPGITSSSPGNGIFSYTVTYAKYTKVGRLVNIAARITGINWTGSPSGYMQIIGAPFTKTTDHFPTSAVTMYYTTFGADSYNTLEFITASSTTTMYVRTTTNGAVGTDLQIGSVNNGNGGLIMSITYYV